MASNQENKGTLVSQTLKVGENKVALFLDLRPNDWDMAILIFLWVSLNFWFLPSGFIGVYGRQVVCDSTPDPLHLKRGGQGEGPHQNTNLYTLALRLVTSCRFDLSYAQFLTVLFF